MCQQQNVGKLSKLSCYFYVRHNKKSSKIPKGKCEALIRRTDNTMTKRKDKGTNNSLPNTVVNQRRTDNTMTKRKQTKGQAMSYKTLHRKLKIEKQQPH